MNNGSAVLHINGVEYQLVDHYTGKESPEFQRLVERMERLLGGTETQIQHFNVLIDGNAGVLMVRPTELVSAAVVFVPEPQPQVY